MLLQDQVCHLRLSKTLKKLEVKQESYFYWLPSITTPTHYYIEHISGRPHFKGHEYSAFTVAELGNMLPITINAGKRGEGISSELLNFVKGHFGKIGNDDTVKWQVMYYDVHFVNAKTEADARAKMLIYLLTNKFV